MAWRFKASKYKNAAPRTVKKEEWIGDISAGNLMQCSGNHIKAGCIYMTFNIDSSGGGNLGLLPVSSSGRLVNGLPLLPAHGDFVTDFEFSPFDDYLLATGSSDNSVKVWLLPEEDKLDELSTLNPVVVVPKQNRKIENVTWNPVAEAVLTYTSQDSVSLFDVTNQEEKLSLSDHKDQIQSLSWRGNGQVFVTSCKDKRLRIIDPRASSVVQETQGHDNMRDSRALWLGDKDIICTTGFSRSREREVKLWDLRNFSSSVSTVGIDSSTGTLIPLYDADTGMLFLSGKGDSNVRYYEISEKDSSLTENNVTRTEQVKGIGMVPKRALNVMEGEVNRLLILTKQAVIPVPYIVPRKNYIEFHDDLFPDTFSEEPGLHASEWFSGANGQRKLVSLNPQRKAAVGSRKGLGLQPSPVKEGVGGASVNVTNQSGGSTKVSNPSNQVETPKKSPTQADNIPKTTPQEQSPVHNLTDEEKAADVIGDDITDEDKVEAEHREDVQKKVSAKIFSGVRQSKFKHLKCKTLHRSTHIENIRKLDRTVPGESNFFVANKARCVVPIEGSGGLLSVFELNSPGKLPDTGIPNLEHHTKVTDYAWDPFNDNRLVVACDDAKIWVWEIPKNGLTETLMTPKGTLLGHMEKIYFVVFHPLARDIIVTSAYDMTVRIWDLAEMKEVIQLMEHPDQVFCAAWSPDGKYLCTVCKDGKIRIFNPRKSPNPIMEGPGPDGSRGARAVFVLEGNYLFVSGFDKQSRRMIFLYDTGDLSQPLYEDSIDESPAILIPYYDEDSNTVFLSGRGNGQLYAYEVATEEPYLFPLATTKFTTPSQAFAFLPKYLCDVKNVEFAKAYRLTQTTVEPVSFTVPRVRLEFFQDDLFPDTRVTWEPTMTSKEWLAGSNQQPRSISLKPKDMTPLSLAPKETHKVKKFDSYNPETYKTDEQKKEELLSAMTNKLSKQEDPLPQDLAEGVDEDEWDD
ncbi:coronin-7-like [Saccostrea cucullata]|uniref:coronin-7-like n=1 Tax=Saccostrea cuccullata TaxID=36930 RepID=UPI002ED363AA